jgi:hypothetical protein
VRSDFRATLEFAGVRPDSKNEQTADDQNETASSVCSSRVRFHPNCRAGPTDRFLRRLDCNRHRINDLENPFSDAAIRNDFDFALFAVSDAHRIVNVPFLVRTWSTSLWSQL